MNAMHRLMVMTVVAIGMAATAHDASAQGYVRRTYPSGGYNNGGYNDGGYRRIPSYPQYPIYQDGGYIDSVNPDGTINTNGVTVYNSVNDPYREMSRYNGSMRQVNRPVYDQYGRIVGYKQGVQWTNNVTGQTHFEGETITNNGMGGVNFQKEFRSAPRSR